MGFYVSMTKPPKIFRLKWPKARITRDFDYMVFGHFKNVHFAVCVPSILNAKFKTSKKWVCDHYAHKTHFLHKNL